MTTCDRCKKPCAAGYRINFNTSSRVVQIMPAVDLCGVCATEAENLVRETLETWMKAAVQQGDP